MGSEAGELLMTENRIINEEPQEHHGRTWRVCTWNDQRVTASWNWGYDGGDIQSMIASRGSEYEATVVVLFGANEKPVPERHTLKTELSSLNAGIQWAEGIIDRIESCRSNWTQQLPALQEIASMLDDEKSRKSKADDQLGDLELELYQLTKNQQSAAKRVVFLTAAINEALGLSPASLAPTPTPLASAAE
jgi:hypothetical protein